MSKAQVAEFAEHVANGLAFEPGDPMEPVVAALNGKIRHHDHVARINGIPESILVKPDGRFVIFMTSLTSEKRDRFTLAHELGHRLLHFPLVHDKYPTEKMVATRWVDENDRVQQRAEWEANWFAAAFLMPEEGFLKAVDRFGLGQAAIIYGVSKRAAEIRLKSLRPH
ncbi:hypothetical protein GCM10011390_29850 [Aureimonas endophytica]|uniref:IrrE N-terminal-like domain-containing protein n=1 Tax=Aureimonas endophytica TaxID=2027858 RepID=A0A916ZQB3_9HYPH|nr:ImmA/IrrE family metallo-endopeptidase [Aureimonas endophytica]GGE08830.1 hypothetical protein GCM10011390_29850 [Aureimonas endophytica]